MTSKKITEINQNIFYSDRTQEWKNLSHYFHLFGSFDLEHDLNVHDDDHLDVPFENQVKIINLLSHDQNNENDNHIYDMSSSTNFTQGPIPTFSDPWLRTATELCQTIHQISILLSTHHAKYCRLYTIMLFDCSEGTAENEDHNNNINLDLIIPSFITQTASQIETLSTSLLTSVPTVGKHQTILSRKGIIQILLQQLQFITQSFNKMQRIKMRPSLHLFDDPFSLPLSINMDMNINTDSVEEEQLFPSTILLHNFLNEENNIIRSKLWNDFDDTFTQKYGIYHHNQPSAFSIDSLPTISTTSTNPSSHHPSNTYNYEELNKIESDKEEKLLCDILNQSLPCFPTSNKSDSKGCPKSHDEPANYTNVTTTPMIPKSSHTSTTTIPTMSNNYNIHFDDDDDPYEIELSHYENLQKESTLLSSTISTSYLDSVQTFEKQMVQITTLLTQFTNLISEQTEEVSNIHENTVRSKENVQRGNEQLVDATNRKRKSKHFFAITFFVMGFILLFFNWIVP